MISGKSLPMSYQYLELPRQQPSHGGSLSMAGTYLGEELTHGRSLPMAGAYTWVEPTNVTT